MALFVLFLCYCCVLLILSGIVNISLGMRELFGLLSFGMCKVCHGLFAFWVDFLQGSYSIQTPNFLNVVVHVIIIDQCNQTARESYL